MAGDSFSVESLNWLRAYMAFDTAVRSMQGNADCDDWYCGRIERRPGFTSPDFDRCDCVLCTEKGIKGQPASARRTDRVRNHRPVGKGEA